MAGAGESATEPRAKILLVDDQPANLLALEAVLQDLGQDLVKVQSGEAALRRLLVDDFAAILLDVQMQGLDGFETAKLVRQRERSRHTPIIFLTVYESVQFPVVEAYRLGAVDYLIKPIVPEILRAKVTVFVELYRKTEQIKRQSHQLREMERSEFERRTLAEQARSAALRADVTAALASGAGEQIVLQRCVDAIVRNLDAAFARIWTINSDCNMLELCASAGLYTHLDGHHSRIPVGSLKIGRIAQKRQPHLTNQALQDPEISDHEWARREGMVAFAGWPLLVDDRLIGVLGLFARQALPENVLQQLSSITDSIAQYIERVRAELSLQLSRQRLDLAIGAAQLGLWYRDLPQDTLDWNEQCKRHFGLPPDASVTVDQFYALVHPEDRERVRQAAEAALQDRTLYDVEFRARGADGQQRWIRAIGKGYYDRTGKPVRFDGITADVTQRRQAEELLRETDRRKDEFIAMLAHELRNPLAPVLHGLHIARQKGSDRVIRTEALDTAFRQAQHLTRLVNDLLDVSRLTQGRFPINQQRMDWAQQIRTDLEDRRRTMDGSVPPVSLETPDGPVWILGDPTRLSQVLHNLLENAAKFSDRDARIQLRLHRDTARDQAVLSVRDWGIGIQPAMLPRVFDAFAQEESSLERTRGGLGLGLAVVRGIVELHGGEVEAASEGPSRGAEFTVRLPLQQELPAISESRPVAPMAQQSLRIVIIEDSRDAANSLRVLLELLGHSVTTVHTGPDGISAVRETKPDVVISDIGLPGMDGYAVARELRKGVTTRLIPLIALTGYSQEEDIHRSCEAGFARHLVKPVEPEVLQQVLAEVGMKVAS